MSFGVPGARYTINSKGRRTVSTGIPGTGLYNVETLSGGRGKSRGSTTKAVSTSEEKDIPFLSIVRTSSLSSQSSPL